ncbi:MAG TPA: DNA-binding domain-containing protein [Verrucomicrobiae bacterium]
MSPDPQLLQLQRRFLAALREPVYGASRELTALPARAGAVSATALALADEAIQSTPQLDARERLELYHRQYWFRILDSLAEDFPHLRRLLGETVFWRLLETYLELVPSRSHTLRHLGCGLADFIRINPGLAGGHPVPAAELAQLEYAWCEIFEQADWPTVAAEDLAAVKLAWQPTLRVFHFHTPLQDIWRQAETETIPAAWLELPPGPPGYGLAIYRHRGRQWLDRLSVAEMGLLQAIRRTGSLVMALEDCPAAADEVSDWFLKWTRLGWLAHPPKSQPLAVTATPDRPQIIKITQLVSS